MTYFRIPIFIYTLFSKNVPNFVDSVHNFGRSNIVHIWFSWPACKKNLELTQLDIDDDIFADKFQRLDIFFLHRLPQRNAKSSNGQLKYTYF